MNADALRIELLVASRSHVGHVRGENQDRALVANFAGEAHGPPWDGTTDVSEAGALLAVCDGMGGAAGGAVASTEAVEVLRARLARPLGTRSDTGSVAARLVDALRIAARTILDHAKREPALSGMGTTATVATLIDRRLLVAQVGDSRAYLLRQGTLTQLTRDQTLVRFMIERGQLTEEQAESFGASNVILQAVGTSLDLDVDVRDLELRDGDVLLLCSDGLSGPVGDVRMKALLTEHPDPSAACDALIAAALEEGAPDNVTCIVARVRGGNEDVDPADELPEARRTIFEPEADTLADTIPPTDPAPRASGPAPDGARRERRSPHRFHRATQFLCGVVLAAASFAACAWALH